MSDNRAYQDARKNKEPKMMVNVPIDHTTSRLSKAAKHLRFCTDEEGNIWAMPVVGYRYDATSGEVTESSPCPTHRALATVAIQAVQNTWYTILDASNVRLWEVAVSMATADETLQVRVTIDGEVYTSGGFAAVAGSHYYISIYADAAVMHIVSSAAAAITDFSRNAPYDAKHILVEMRKTTAAGLNVLTGGAWYQTF